MLYNAPMKQNGKMITNGADGGLDEAQQEALVATVITGNPDYLIEAIASKGEELQEALARSGGPIQAVIADIQAEYRAYLEIQMTLLQGTALQALSDVMEGRVDDNAAPAVSAANSILSRGSFPVRSRQESMSVKVKAETPLPDFDSVLEQAGSEDERLALADKMTSLLGELEILKGGNNEQADDEA